MLLVHGFDAFRGQDPLFANCAFVQVGNQKSGHIGRRRDQRCRRIGPYRDIAAAVGTAQSQLRALGYYVTLPTVPATN